jgi:3-hydroxyacyl-[acyl-carrier-protein] dehydratase
LFDGHFPGHPILPGAKLLDLVIACLRSSGELPAGAIDIVSAKFLAMVAPASALALSWTRSADGACRFECHRGDRKVAVGALRAAAGPA